MARKDDSPAISLFSFQDIITSLTGIMFLVVLLLVIFMMDLHKADDPKTVKETRQISEAASKRARELKKQLVRLRKQEAQYQTRIRELQKLDLDSLWIRLESMRRELQKHQVRIRNLAAKRSALKKAAERQQQQLKDLRERADRENQECIASAQRVQKLQEELKKKYARTVKVRNALKYVVENDTSFAPVLVECTPAGIRIMECSTGQETDLRIAGGSFTERRRRFVEWVRQRGRNDEYYTILLKPGSVEYEVLLDDLDAQQKRRGLELLPSDDLSLWGGA